MRKFHILNTPNLTRRYNCSRGKYLYKPNGDRFYIKGVAYQEAAPIATSTAANQANGGFPEPDSFVDPLSAENAANCTRDIANLKTLGVNTVRVYSVNVSMWPHKAR